MNAQRYRLIFNRHRGQLMAVGENAAACSKPASGEGAIASDAPRRDAPVLARWHAAAFAVMLVCGADLMVLRVAQAQTVAYKAASASQRPTILQAGNGVPLINIQTPSAAGVSHNLYQQFDVDAQGAILNNSRSNVQTQLGGWVQGNPWLARGSARVILNEVLSTNPSRLMGYVEVAGSQAEIVIANPAGITCNGCGFINASRATLATGTPVMNGGNLDGYRVEGGTVRIEGAGMDASRVGYTDIIARAVEVNAGLWAQTLKVTAGSNQINAENTQAVPIAGNGSAPAFAIDVAQLGGMYAGKITLVGTEAGVGVRNAGQIGASAGEVAITADGKLINSGSLSAAGSTRIVAASAENSGTVYAREQLDISTSGEISNKGGVGSTIAAGSDVKLAARQIAGDGNALFAAGLSENGSLAGNGKLTLTAEEQVVAHGQQAAAGDLTIRARQLDLSGSRNGASNLALSAQNGDLDLSGATTVTAGTLAAHTAHTLIHVDARSQAGQLDLAARALDNRRGEIVQTGSGDTVLSLAAMLNNGAGRIAANSRQITLTAQTLDNTAGRIEHAGDGALALTAGTLAGKEGRIHGNGTLKLAARTVTLDAAETVAARLDIAVESLSQRGGRMLYTGSERSNITVTGSFDNRGGTLAGNGHLKVAADSLDNRDGGQLTSLRDFALAAATLANASGRIESGGALDARISGSAVNASGRVIAGSALTLSADRLDNTAGTVGAVAGGMAVTTLGTLDNTGGRIEAGQDIALESRGLINREGTVLGRKISVDTHRQVFDNTLGTLAATGTLAIDSGALSNDAGRIRATGDLAIDTHGATLTNTNAGSTGGILGEAKVTLIAGQLENNAGFAGAKGTLNVRGDTLANTGGGRLVSESGIALELRALDNRSGRIETADDLTLVASGSADNRGGLLRSGAALNVDTAALNNTDTLGTDQGVEAKRLAIRANDLDNRRGALRADTALAIDSHASLDNRSGLISSAQALTVRDSAASRTLAVLNDGGTLLAGEQLDLVAASLAGGKLLSHRDLTISLGGNLDNSGEITANRNAAINVAGTLVNAGKLQAGQRLSVTAGSLENQAGGEILSSELCLAATASQTLTNRGLIDGGDIRIDAITLNNLGTGRIYGNQLAIAASTLNNHAEAGSSPIIAARGRLDLGVGALSNREGALIFSAGDMAIGGTLDATQRASGRAVSVTNASATVEALGALTIAAGRIDNTNEHFSTRTENVGTQSITEYQGEGGVVRYTRDQVSLVPHEKFTRLVVGSSVYNNWFLYEYQRTTTETRIASSDPGKILAGGTMALFADALRNDNSQVLSGGALTATLGRLDNTETTGERTRTERGIVTHHWRQKADGKDKQGLTPADYAPAPTIETIALAVGGYGGNTAVAGSGTSVAGQSAAGATTRVADSVGRAAGVAPGMAIDRTVRLAVPSVKGGVGMIVSLNAPIVLPKSSLFRNTSTPTARYLIETDPRFTSYRLWLSSDHMLKALALDPATTQKRLGDGFYEQRLIAEQVGQLTGRRFLVGYADDEAQYRALMDAGVTYAKAWNLIPGIALSAEQMAQLTTDIVWFVEKTVTLPDGSTQKVLAPQVYARVQTGDLAPGGSLIAGSTLDLKLAGDLINSGTIAGRERAALSADNVRNLGRVTGREVSVDAARQLSVQGGRLEAERMLIVRAGGDLTVESTTRTQSNAQGSRTHIDRLAGLYVTGEGGALLARAGRDLTLNAARIESAGSATLAAGQNLALGSVQESKQQTIVWDAKNRRSESHQQDTGSTIHSRDDLALLAGRELTARAAQVVSDKGAITAFANDIRIESGEARYALDETHQRKSKGFLSSKTKTTRDTLETTTALASTFSGDKVMLAADRDILIKGSNVVATGDAALIAGRDLKIEAATETHQETHFKQTKQSGIFGSGGVGFTIGSRMNSTDQDTQRTAAAKSTVGSTDGNVSITAGNAYRQVGSDVITPRGDIDIAAKRIEIVEARETSRTVTETKTAQTGLTLAITSPVITAIQTAQQMSEAARDTKDSRMKLLAAANVGMAANNAANAIKAGQGSTINGKEGQIATGKDETGNLTSRDATAADQAGGINLSISIGGSKSSSQRTEKSDHAAGSNLTAGGNIKITAQGAGKDSDILIQGSELNAGKNLTLKAEDDIRLLAAKNTDEQHSTNKNASASVGISFGTDGFLINVGASGGKGKADGSDTAWSNSHLAAGNTVTLDSGADTTLKGAVVQGQQVIAKVGGDLKLESLQDTSTFDAKQKSLGVSVSFGYGKVGGSVSASQSKIDSDYASVVEQTGIKAGDGGFQVDVKGNTDLKGAVIASTQTAIDEHKNRFETGGELTTSDIQNQAHYSAKSVSVNLGSSMSFDGALKPGGTSAGLGKDSGSANSTTTAGISGIAGNKDARTGDKETGIGKIFDQTNVQKEIEAQTKITQKFGELAPEAWGKHANTKFAEALKTGDEAGMRCWGPDGTCRAGGHALIGGLAGGIGGAAGAGVSSVAMPHVQAYLVDQGVPAAAASAVTQLAAIGAGAAVGGTAGATTAFNEASNNAVVLVVPLVETIMAGGAAAIRACASSPACRNAVRLAGNEMVAKILSMLPKDEQSTLPGFGAGEQPKPSGPLVNVPVKTDPKDGVETYPATPPVVSNTTGGTQIKDPKPGDNILITPNNGPVGGVVVFSEKYVPSPKHDLSHGWGTPMDLPDIQAQQVLNGSTQFGKQRYGLSEGKIYEFQPDNAGGWHGYPIPGNEAPPSFLRDLRDQGKITNSEYGKLIRGK